MARVARPQLALFITSSVVCLALFRSRLSELLNRETNEASALVEQEQVGRRVSVVRAISPDHPGRVLVHGVEWSARSDEALAEGEVAEVVGRESITLVVRRAPPRGQA
ncbi:MAG: NfeD family protein [Deltaproteobacteria bacterium]|nr:NfeD family protein [Deltaproteobacteria bacterium]